MFEDDLNTKAKAQPFQKNTKTLLKYEEMDAQLFKVNEVLHTKIYLSVLHALSTNKAVSAHLITKLVEENTTELQFTHDMEYYCGVRVHGIPCLHLRIILIWELYGNNMEALYADIFRFNDIPEGSPSCSNCVVLPTVPASMGTTLHNQNAVRKLLLQPVAYTTSLEDGHQNRRLRDDRRFEYVRQSNQGEAAYWKCATNGCAALAFSYERWIMVTNVHDH